jgi:hypothetical protein
VFWPASVGPRGESLLPLACLSEPLPLTLLWPDTELYVDYTSEGLYCVLGSVLGQICLPGMAPNALFRPSFLFSLHPLLAFDPAFLSPFLLICAHGAMSASHRPGAEWLAPVGNVKLPDLFCLYHLHVLKPRRHWNAGPIPFMFGLTLAFPSASSVRSLSASHPCFSAPVSPKRRLRGLSQSRTTWRPGSWGSLATSASTQFTLGPDRHVIIAQNSCSSRCAA